MNRLMPLLLLVQVILMAFLVFAIVTFDIDKPINVCERSEPPACAEAGRCVFNHDKCRYEEAR